MSPWLNIVQACVWIETGDATILSLVGPEVGLKSESELIPGNSLAGADVALDVLAAHSGKPRLSIDVDVARRSLQQACSEGTVSLRGRRCGKGDPQQIPVDDWASLIIRDEGIRGIIAGPQDRTDASATWWDQLRVRAADVERLRPKAPPVSCEVAAEDLAKPTHYADSQDRATIGINAPATAKADNEAALIPGKLPTYEKAPTYDSDRVPTDFMDWAKEQHRAGVIITVPMAEDAMRGPNDGTGHRYGGLLKQGPGLGRDTIREWVKTLDATWIARQGVPPSRSSKP